MGQFEGSALLAFGSLFRFTLDPVIFKSLQPLLLDSQTHLHGGRLLWFCLSCKRTDLPMERQAPLPWWFVSESDFLQQKWKRRGLLTLRSL